MDFIITGKPSDEGLSQLIDSLLHHIIQNKLHEQVLTVSEAGSETVS